MKRFIYQIGRFDVNYRNNLRFVYEGKPHEKPLSSLALKEHFGNDAEVVLVYPVSIVYNEYVVNRLKGNDDFVSKILNELDSYLSNPYEVLKEHPHNKEADDFIVVHSLGKYKKPDGSGDVIFEGSYGDVVLGIVCDLIERYLKDRTQTVFYFDISSGHNIYVSALLEAAKHISVFGYLFNWLNKNFRPKIYIAFTEPILGSSEGEVRIYTEEMKFKAFFSSPIKAEGIKKPIRDNLRDYLEKFAIVFSALKNNTPLAIYHFDYHDYKEIKNAIKGLIGKIKELLSQNWQKSQNLRKNDYINTLLALGFYAGIVEVLSKDVHKYDINSGVHINTIKTQFCGGGIYDTFSLSTHKGYLGVELENLRKRCNDNCRNINTWNSFHSDNAQDTKKFQRNFFAHAGFEDSVIQFKCSGKHIYLRYNPQKEKEIKELLINNL